MQRRVGKRRFVYLTLICTARPNINADKTCLRQQDGLRKRQITQGFKLVSLTLTLTSDPSPVVQPSDALYPGENRKPIALWLFLWLVDEPLVVSSSDVFILGDQQWTKAISWWLLHFSRFTLAGAPDMFLLRHLWHTGFLLRFSGPFLMLGPADTLEVPLADILLAPKLTFSLSLGEDTPPSVTTLISRDIQTCRALSHFHGLM